MLIFESQTDSLVLNKQKKEKKFWFLFTAIYLCLHIRTYICVHIKHVYSHTHMYP